MSQVFSADSVSNAVSVTLASSGETALVTGNFVSPPFQNAKAVILASVNLITGTGTTVMGLRIRRNPNGENLQIGSTQNAQPTVGVTTLLGLSVADPIPDGRPVQYQLTFAPTGASATGTSFSATITTILISG